MHYLAAAHAQTGTSEYFTLLLISIAMMATGFFVAFDPFGFIAKTRVPRSPKSLELEEKWGIPDVTKVVGGGFLCVGVLCLIFCLVIGVVMLMR